VRVGRYWDAMPLHLTYHPGTRADVRAELRRLSTHFEQLGPVPHDVEVEALGCRRIVGTDGPWAFGSEGPHPEAAGRRLVRIAALAREEPEAFRPIFELYGWADYVLVAGHLLLRGLAQYEQFRDGVGPAAAPPDGRARDLYDLLGLPTLPWSRHLLEPGT
jgi:hypothetical protein